MYILWNGSATVGRSYVAIDVLEKVIGRGVAAVVDVRRIQGATWISIVISHLGGEGWNWSTIPSP